MSPVLYNPGFKSVGFRDCVVYELDSNGFPNAVDENPYVGHFISGPKVFTLNIPNPRLIQHTGRDRVEETDQLPTLEAANGEIRSSGVDLDVDAFLQGTKKDTHGAYSTFITRNTDKQGFEPQIGIIAWQQSMLRGARRWHYYLIPSSRAIAISGGMEENPVDHRYTVNINPVEKTPWGTALTELDNGSLQAGYIDLYSTLVPTSGKFPMVSFRGDGIQDTFVFTDYKNGKTDYAVTVNGVLVTGDITKTDGQIVFTDYIPEEEAVISVWLV